MLCLAVFLLAYESAAQYKANVSTDIVLTLGANQGNVSAKTGFVPVDGSFVQALPASDDSVSAVIKLPFSFCFFGEQVDSLFINNNGNLSIHQPFAANTPLTFPLPAVADIGVIAPFWSDVDTRLQGMVKYKVTSSSIIVVWEEVSHYELGDSLTNTYQVVITDGTDPLLPLGYNIAFFFGDMQWTTGDASNGVNGFQGVPAVSGMNRGNGNDFMEIGRFNQDNASYDGPGGMPDGVQWLDFRNFYINSCDSVNTPPIVSGVDLSDTMRICGVDTFDYEITFIGPESNQLTQVSANSGLPGFQLNNSVGQGFTNSIVSFTASSNPYDTIRFFAQDNGSPLRTSIFPVTIELDSLTPRPVITGDTSACPGDSVTLSLTASYNSYMWSTGDTTDTIRVPVGTYTVTVSDSSCAEVATFVVQDATPALSISGDAWLCFPDTAMLFGTQGFSNYQWSSGANDTLDSVEITLPGTYYVTATLGGCTAIDSFDVKSLGVDSYAALPASGPSCNGDSVLIDAGAGFDAYAWSTLSTNQTELLPGGSYTVTVSITNPAGTACSDSDTVVVNLVNVTTPTITGDTSVCSNGSGALFVSASYQSFAWSTGDTTPGISITSGGTYSVTVTQQGCAQDTFTIVQDILVPTFEISGGIYSCGGDTVDLDAGPGWDSLFWSTGDTTQILSVIPGTYTATAWINGCSISDVHQVDTLKSGISVLGDTIVCPGATTVLSVDAFFDNYLWNTGATVDSVVVGPGDYQVIVSLDTCAVASDTITVVSSGTGFEIIGDSVVCDGNLRSLYVESRFTNYTWSNGSLVSSTRVSSPGLYSVTVTDAAGCVLTDSVQVNYVPLPNPVITGDTIYCSSAGTVLATTLSYDAYYWSTAYTTPTTVAGTGAYTVTVTDTNGCMNAADTFFVASGEVFATILGDSAGCIEGNYTLFTNEPGNYLWSTGDTTDTINVNRTGIYSLTVSNDFGCIDSTDYEIITYAFPVVDFEVDPQDESVIGQLNQFTDLTTLASGSIASWNWNFGDTAGTSTLQDPEYAYTRDGVYNVRLTVTSDEGCVAWAEKRYEIDSEVKATNVITPNGDGINDLLVFDKLELFPGSELFIYNRWGDLVFESQDYRNNWDGRFMSDGVYYYVLKLNGSDKVIQSNFTIINN